jgi:hypothetical protein
MITGVHHTHYASPPLSSSPLPPLTLLTIHDQKVDTRHSYTHTLMHSYTHTLMHSYTHALIHSYTIHSYTIYYTLMHCTLIHLKGGHPAAGFDPTKLPAVHSVHARNISGSVNMTVAELKGLPQPKDSVSGLQVNKVN